MAARSKQTLSPQAVLAVLDRAAPRPLSLREIAERLGLERFDRRELEALLSDHVATGHLRRIGPARWQRPVERAARGADRGPRQPPGGEMGDRAVGRVHPGRTEARERRVPDGGRRGSDSRGWGEPGARQDRRDGRDGRERRDAPRLERVLATVEGRFSRARAGFGFVEIEGSDREHFPRDIFVAETLQGSALTGDRVRVEVLRREAWSGRASGRVVDVVEAGVHRIVGVLDDAVRPMLMRRSPRRRRWETGGAEAGAGAGISGEPGPAQERRRYWLVPLSDLLPLVEITGGIEASPFDVGKIAVVRLERRADGVRGPSGELERILGDPEDPEVQFLTIAIEHDLRLEFPRAALDEAARLPADPVPADHLGREDLRELPFVTIDGETARDFDDAVCLESIPGKGSRVRVAIADVSHYVRPGSAIDLEAQARGTSVYFPDRAVPMLPDALSAGLCSLLPGQDRLAMVAEIELDRKGARRSTRFFRAVIRSRARLTYTQVAAVLSSTDAAPVREQRRLLDDLMPQLQAMRELMRVLHRRRIAAGSLDLDLPEALVDLSDEGRSVGVRLAARNDAHRIIEEMMLEANQAVALHLGERGLPFPYRVHEPPDPADIAELNELLDAFGARVELEDGEAVKPSDVQRALARLEGHRLERVLSRQVLRALKLARYTTQNAGHFGLAFPTYCHFTSPIRRYPDLLVHRQLAAVLDRDEDQARELGGAIEALAVASSQCERRAMGAERTMLDLKKAEFMLDHLLEPEVGTIVGVAKFGAFVELDAFPVEGLVRADDLSEPFQLDERAQALVGVRTQARLRLGDRVLVEATDVSLRRRQVTFAFLRRIGEDPPDESGGAPSPRRGSIRRKRRRPA